ncbi:MAG: RnfABCDGE type electron transport complex subunit D [Pseudomonadota bacterium]
MKPALHVAPSPHLPGTGRTTKTVMIDVLIGLAPVVLVAVYVFHWYAIMQIGICVIGCLAAEAAFTKIRGKALQLQDCSAAVTGVILGLSMPGPAPWFIGVIASFAAMGIGKIIFGGLGMNLFNPAMVGRAFVMLGFAGFMGASGYEVSQGAVDIMSQATPLTAFKQSGVTTPLLALVLGNTNGSLGETSAIACLLGGIFLCIRRTASWEIPAGVILTSGLIAVCVNLIDMTAPWTVLHHLASGALLFGAFFIATDPVSSPVTPKGKWIFGIGVGAVIMLLRLFSGYPEGVMFAVLLMNSVTPLINRWTIPEPFGGIPAPAK